MGEKSLEVHQTGAAANTLFDVLELLAASARPVGVTEIARTLSLSKARVHRNLRALVDRGYARQDADTDRYSAGIKLVVLGEAVREQFNVGAAARPEMVRLRDTTGQAVTTAAPIDGALTVVELVQGRTVIEFGIRPGTQLAYHASAHGRVALAFGSSELRERVLAAPLPAWTPHTTVDASALRREVEIVRRQGWATADGQVLVGVNALAAPILDHGHNWCGSIALVGSSQFIPARPDPAQAMQVTDAARRVSRHLGHPGHPGPPGHPGH